MDDFDGGVGDLNVEGRREGGGVPGGGGGGGEKIQNELVLMYG